MAYLFKSYCDTDADFDYIDGADITVGGTDGYIGGRRR